MIIWQQRQDNFLFSVLWEAMHDVRLKIFYKCVEIAHLSDTISVYIYVLLDLYSCKYLNCKSCVHVSQYLCGATYSLPK